MIFSADRLPKRLMDEAREAHAYILRGFLMICRPCLSVFVVVFLSCGRCVLYPNIMNKATDCPIILLAAGASTRMRGRDKLLEVVDNQPLIRRQADRARAATSGPVFVMLPAEGNHRRSALSGCDVQIIPVPDANTGMAASLRCGISALPEDAAAAMILLADLPDLTQSDIEAVGSCVDTASDTLIWRGATDAGAPGHPIVFARPLFAALSALQGDTGGAAVAKAHAHQTILIPLPGQNARRDLDTPEDWDDWRAEHPR